MSSLSKGFAVEFFLLAILACFTDVKAKEPQPITKAFEVLTVQSIYSDKDIYQNKVFTGSGFLVKLSATRTQLSKIYAVTSAHLIEGMNLKIADAKGRLCTTGASYIDDESDLAIIEVEGCQAAITFERFSKETFLTSLNREHFEQSPYLTLSHHQVLFDSSKTQAASSKQISKIHVSENLNGDLLTNISIFQGLSGSPIVEHLAKNDVVKNDHGIFNYKLSGIAKASWRFFRFSKLVNPKRLEALLNVANVHMPVSIEKSQWVLRQGVLNQEWGEHLRDASLKILPTGNGISVDTGNGISVDTGNGISVDTGAIEQNSQKLSEIVRQDLENFKNSGAKLGMHYFGKNIIAFQVKVRNQLPDTTPFLVYASLSNYKFLVAHSAVFKIEGSVEDSENLYPFLQSRFIAAGITPNVALSTLQSQWNLAKTRTLFAKDLFQVFDNSDKIWGWDLRGLVMLDFEGILVSEASNPMHSSEVLKAVLDANKECEVKAFGTFKNSSYLLAQILKL